jgi:hypothetical protein
MAYDGSESSVYAIKQFAYLFQEFVNSKTQLVNAKKGDDNKIPDEMNIQELAARHFPDLAITKLDIDRKNNFADWVSEKKAAILVSGSFGRPVISRLFHKNFVSH